MRRSDHDVSGFIEEMELFWSAFNGAGFGAVGAQRENVGGNDFHHASTKSIETA